MALNAFQLIMYGRFWVIPEANSKFSLSSPPSFSLIRNAQVYLTARIIR